MTEHWTYCKPRIHTEYIHTYIHTYSEGQNEEREQTSGTGKRDKKKKRGGLKSRPRIKKNKKKKEGLLGL